VGAIMVDMTHKTLAALAFLQFSNAPYFGNCLNSACQCYSASDLPSSDLTSEITVNAVTPPSGSLCDCSASESLGCCEFPDSITMQLAS
jgi:hypothetical protein